MLETIRSALWGKSHYFDPETIRWFKSRFGEWRTVGSPLPQDRSVRRYAVAVESTEWEGRVPRKYRVVIVDLRLGRVQNFNAAGPGNDSEHDWPTSAQAKKLVREATSAWCWRAFQQKRKVKA